MKILFLNENEKLCRFLYGETWRIKLKKYWVPYGNREQ